MPSVPKHQFDVLVVGGGPAGIAAAACAAECGVKVGIADDNPMLGGQIWRGESRGKAGDIYPRGAVRWLDRVQASGVTFLSGTRVFHHLESGVLTAEADDALFELSYKRLIFATGARERFLPFPGWTIPNVMGAGGLQAMVKSGLPIAGKRVVVAGSGPLLLAVAAYLLKHGAEIPIICEQASWKSLAKFGLALLSQPGKIFQAWQFKNELRSIPFATNSWPILAAHGGTKLESVTISRSGKPETVACDYLACGFHLVPNIELALLLGCQLRAGYVQVDEFQQTTVPGVFCAGEPTGIGGVELSLIEGQIAGYAAGGRQEQARRLFAAHRKSRKFARILERTFRLRSELRTLAASETIVCRCEDITHSRLQEHTSWRDAKLQTRCGMGPCQGRICGPATQFLFKWNPDSVRPPVFPASIEHLAYQPTRTQLEEDALVGGQR
jgi:D-hydroxyproline dehydrogenase subunit alpha